MKITTYHGEVVEAQTGQFIVKEYRKGFLNRVYVCNTRERADVMKRRLQMDESYMMTPTKHFNIQEVK